MKVHDNLPPNIRRIVNDVGGEVRLPEPVKHKEASIEELVSKVKTDAQTMNLIQKLLYKGKGMISK